MKVIKGNNLKFVGSGAFGEFHRIGKSKWGVKIFTGSESQTKADALDCDLVDDAQQELNNLKRAARRTKLVPRPGVPVLVEFDADDRDYPCVSHFYMIGYTMQYIDGKPVGDSNLSKRDHRLYEEAFERLRNDGVRHGDDHNHNIIKRTKVTRNKFIFVDANTMHLKEDSDED